MEIFQLPELAAQPQKSPHSHQASLTNKENDSGGDKHFTWSLYYTPGSAAPINRAQANNDITR